MADIRVATTAGDGSAELRRCPAPESASDRTVVGVTAVGLNHTDLRKIDGKPSSYSATNDRLGIEFSGYVLVGPEGKGWPRPGTRVAGLSPEGTLAEQIAVSDEFLFEIPQGIGMIEAGALAETYMTAFDHLVLRIPAVKDRTILVTGASGGVGISTIQLAAALGGSPVAVTSDDRKGERLREEGAEEVIVAGDAVEMRSLVQQLYPDGVDVVVDTLGGPYLEVAVELLRRNGWVCAVGATVDSNASLNLISLLGRAATIEGSTLRGKSRSESEHLTAAFVERLLPRFLSGELSPVVEHVVAMADLDLAIDHLRNRRRYGRVVIDLGYEG